jgi:hypothetical protein
MSSPDVHPGTFHCILQHSTALRNIILGLTSVNDTLFFFFLLKKKRKEKKRERERERERERSLTLPTEEPVFTDCSLTLDPLT